TKKKPAVAPTIRIGFFANVTHSPALVAQELGLFEKYLSKDKTKVEFVAFNAGPAAVEAMKAGAIDVTYIGPNPAINAFASTRGKLIKIISGSTSGGAEFVVKPSIQTVDDLKGKKFATPQLGNTQDVALRSWLKSKDLTTSVVGSGDVTVIPTENAQTLALFQRGDIDGAWLPEPWSTRLVLEAGAKVFLDEKTLWPKGEFVTTHIISSSDYLKKYPGTIQSLLNAHFDAITYINKNSTMAQDLVQKQIEKWTGKRLPDAVMARAWKNLSFTPNPIANSLEKSADDAVEIGLLTTLGSRGLNGIYDLRILNSILKVKKIKAVTANGLGLN
ncbi:MAG: ABC transporter substrate-binding protein, partial [Candidatus Nanopelagicaceae bacterium]